MEITCRVYRPRQARETPLFRLVEQHLEEFLRVYPERFAKAHGPLRPVVERVLRGFLKCGIVSHGFARAWCETCRLSYLIPYSCRGRSFCPSCEKKRSILWAELYLLHARGGCSPRASVVMFVPGGRRKP